jgi:SAM-dependent methyltransferase
MRPPNIMNYSKIVNFLLSATLIGVFIFLIYQLEIDFNAISEMSFFQFFLLFTLSLLAIATNGSKLKNIVSVLGIRLSAREWFGLSSVSATLNNLFFKAGSLVTSNYLKRKYDFHYMSFVGSQGADQLILLFSNAIIGTIVCGYIVYSQESDIQWMVACYAILAANLFALMNCEFMEGNNESRLADALRLARDSLVRILKNRRLLFVLCGHNSILILLHSLRFYVCCLVFQLDIPFTHCLLFNTAMTFLSAVPLPQSDVGGREILVGLMSEALGSGFDAGLTVTAADRILILLWGFLCAIGCRMILVPSSISLLVSKIYIKLKQILFPGSIKYWEQRYTSGISSGQGSYGRLAAFKAEIINNFVSEYRVESVIEFGCGDGNQLKLANYPTYVGLDVSKKAVEICKEQFPGDASKNFFLYEPHCFDEFLRKYKVDLALSLDVIYHLVEDDIYSLHLKHLFGAAGKYVIIYASDKDDSGRYYEQHVRHRNFTKDIAELFPSWKLRQKIKNRYPIEKVKGITSFADFFVYETD